VGGKKKKEIKEKGEVENKNIIYGGLYCKIGSCLFCCVGLTSRPSWSETLLDG
jgi:hypothetical protein